MQFADPTRGRSQPRVCKARAKPELQGPHFPVGARKCLQGGKTVSQTQSDHMSPFPQGPGHLVYSYQPQTPPLSDGQEAVFFTVFSNSM